MLSVEHGLADIKKPEVWRDLLSHVDYISADNPDAAERFIDATEATFNLLASNPLLGGLCAFEHPAARDIRRWSVHGFKRCVIYYRPLTDWP